MQSKKTPMSLSLHTCAQQTYTHAYTTHSNTHEHAHVRARARAQSPQTCLQILPWIPLNHSRSGSEAPLLSHHLRHLQGDLDSLPFNNFLHLEALVGSKRLTKMADGFLSIILTAYLATLPLSRTNISASSYFSTYVSSTSWPPLCLRLPQLFLPLTSLPVPCLSVSLPRASGYTKGNRFGMTYTPSLGDWEQHSCLWKKSKAMGKNRSIQRQGWHSVLRAQCCHPARPPGLFSYVRLWEQLCLQGHSPSLLRDIILVSGRQGIWVVQKVIPPSQVQTPGTNSDLIQQTISHSWHTQIPTHSLKGKLQRECQVKAGPALLVWGLGEAGRAVLQAPVCTTYHWQSTCLLWIPLNTSPNRICSISESWKAGYF